MEETQYCHWVNACNESDVKDPRFRMGGEISDTLASFAIWPSVNRTAEQRKIPKWIIKS
jgi:hypothetical protein